jgi:nucleoside-diphosphate-sugar epimerase
MKVLLTGGSGFVGSHILDRLWAEGIPTTILVRPTSSRRFLAGHLPDLEVRTGALSQPATLGPALEGITHVIHCAGCTKAVRSSDFYEINHLGTRNLLDAINSRGDCVQRLIHISSLAAIGPATPARPARETDPPHPVSHYGQSKLAAELEVRAHCRPPATILRPAAVYGPRDEGFLSMFRAVKNHFLPCPTGGQALSLVFVEDLAGAVVNCLVQPSAAGRTYFVAGAQVVTPRQMAHEIARAMNTWTVPLPLPKPALWPLCLGAELMARVRRKPSLLNLQKFRELGAPGWVCDPSRIEEELGFHCHTPLESGFGRTLEWYRREKWL